MAGFVDEAQLNVRGGDGGAGCVSFRREAHTPRGGPDGGDGGRGGDVWLVADPEVASLLAFRDHPHRKATNGTHGSGKARHGSNGDDKRVGVPVGTLVKDTDGRVVADLIGPGDSWLAAGGGRGGKGNARFLSNRRRAPSFAEQGEEGQERWLRLELKLMADVALVGFPNAGKSTLISRISAAKPKIADYPFTTLEPHLGVVRVDDHEIVIADIPGLIEGASEGRGLGHQFLRHVERARVLLVLIDLGPLAEASPRDQERVLLRELESYRPELVTRPRVIVGTKADVASASGPSGQRDGGPSGQEREGGPSGQEREGWTGDFLISAVTGEGLPPLLRRTAALVVEARAATPVDEGFVIHRPAAEGIQVERGPDGGFVVLGQAAQRAVALSDLTDAQALAYAHDRLRRLGVDRALARAGAREGDTVHIGRLTFEYRNEGATGGVSVSERPPNMGRRRR
ncbi:MAG TPA: GTPase ObgE [Acidimicrobiales bacterium]|nr:GTPase ObgE [Acidimicrobiales bacterium]